MKKTLSMLLSFVMLISAVTAVPFYALADCIITRDMVTVDRTTFIYDGQPKSPQATVKDGDTVLEDGANYNILYLVDEPELPALEVVEGGGEQPEREPQYLEISPYEAGDYLMVIVGIEGYEGYVEIPFSIVEDSNSFGTACEDSGKVFFVSDTGTTSAVMKPSNEDENKIVWLREESDGTAAWYGFDNSEGALPEGSVVSVSWLDEDEADFQEHYEKLDDEYKKKAEDGKLWLFDLEACNSSGDAIHEFEGDKQMQVYVELGNDWDVDDIEALFVADGKDERINARLDKTEDETGHKQYAVLTLDHFSTYVIYGVKNAPKTASIAKAKVTGVNAKTYTGKALTQSLTVKLGSITLKKGTDYKVTYKNNKSVGTASVTVTGTGKYTGTVTKTFKINPKGTSLKKVAAGKKAFTATWNKRTAQTTGYQIQYSASKKFTKKTTKSVTVANKKKTSKTVKKLKACKKYYVRVRTYKKVGKKKYYSAWSRSKAVTTKK